MNLEVLMASSIDGLTLGFVFGLMAMGLTLIFGVMKVINLGMSGDRHGDVHRSGPEPEPGINPYLSLPIVVVLGLVTGIVMYFVAVHRVINAPN